MTEDDPMPEAVVRPRFRDYLVMALAGAVICLWALGSEPVYTHEAYVAVAALHWWRPK